MRTTLRARLAFLFAAAVGVSLLVSGGATIGVLVLQARADRESEIARGLPDDDDELAIEKAATAMAVVAPLAMAGAALLGLFLARRALRPMREASLRARAARASELDLSLPVTGAGDEWDDLAGTLNSLHEEARASLSRMRRFTADAAHELRTPVTAIIGEAEVALRRERSAAELRTALREVKCEGQRLAALLEALLALARADSGTLLTSRSPALLDEIVRRSVERAQQSASSLGRSSLIVECSGSGGVVEGNAILLSRALENLLDNAVRHARERVTVTLAEDGGTARIRVRDDGNGIEPDLVPALFQRFVRGDPARTGEGFGLGLSIARAIAEAHDGRLELCPCPGGAAFELTLPLSR